MVPDSTYTHTSFACVWGVTKAPDSGPLPRGVRRQHLPHDPRNEDHQEKSGRHQFQRHWFSLPTAVAEVTERAG